VKRKETAIVLIGMPAAGKSTVGAAVARQLGRPHLDIDELILQTTGLAPADLLRRQGEAAFRLVESAALDDALQHPSAVISTGGGAPLFHDGLARMAAVGTVVWLDVPVAVLAQRTLSDGDRPLLGDTRQAQEAALAALATARAPTYARAHTRVDAARPVARVAQDVCRAALAPEVFDVPGGQIAIHGGHICDAAQRLSELAGVGRIALIAERALAAEAEKLAAMLQARGTSVVMLSVPGGEKSKDLRHCQSLWQQLGEHGIDRSDLLVTVGGGATTDLGGFVAATWLRGVAVVHMPTTVLAMADASVGGKTAINTPQGKNLVGAFHLPRLTWLALAGLDGLPGRDWRAGLAEIAKIFACLDANAWHDFIGDARRLRARDAKDLRRHLTRAIELKAAIVEQDPRDEGRRTLLNFGHTVGHAIEAQSRFAVRHGEAVALGMVAAAEVSEAQGWAPQGTAAEIRAGLHALGLPIDYEAHLTAEVTARLGSDKKARGGQIAFVALAGLGQAHVRTCSTEQLSDILHVLASVAQPAGCRRSP